jgi:hypothetical protein
MDLILDVTLAPTDDAKLTPLETLRDFAYTSPGWHYLEDASRHYADEKGANACILRHHVLDGSADVDLAFARHGEPQALRLTIIQPGGEGGNEGGNESGAAERDFSTEQRNEIAEHFLEHLRAHLDQQGRHAELHVERGEADAMDGES